jgi:phospholipase C
MNFRPLLLPAAAIAAISAYACATMNRGSRESVASTATPIKHVVVIYGENISFDHYFGLYPNATNPPGEPAFVAAANTPEVNGLRGGLLTENPNLNPENGAGAANPFRLDRTQAATSDQGHAYTPEQRAYNDGKLDLFPKYTGRAMSGGTGAFATKGIVMGYFDGNTVTALWNYAQRFAMSDNAYGDQYGPSTPGAINLIAGQTNGLRVSTPSNPAYAIGDGQGGLTLIGDIDPARDSCSNAGGKSSAAMFTGKNIGDLLNDAGLSWGWFQGGFDLTATNANGTTGCARSTHSDVTNFDVHDYVPHHEPFQYYASTANPSHARPVSVATIGTARDTSGNHQYDMRDFYAAVSAGNFPAVSFLKAPAYENGHAGNSDPLDEQRFVVEVINFLQQQPGWRETAVIIAYDDSDGWYDHQMAPIGNASFDSTADQISGPGRCGVRGRTTQARGVASNKPVNGRCGPGTRQPFLVVSPWARVNYVDHAQTTQASIIRFIEDNWLGGKRLGGGSFDATTGNITGLFDFSGQPHMAPLYLDPELGTVVSTPPARR